MIREVDFVDYYLPPFMQKYEEPVAALNAEEPEFVIVWKAVDRILYNHFVSTADEYGISRFEKMLGIYPSAEDTLESRRARVHSKWFNSVPYTWRVLLQKLTVLCAETDFVLSHNFKEGYTLTLVTDLELFGQVEELEHIINTIIPENIVVVSKNNIPCDIKGVVLFGGGICFSNMFTITNDFKETYSVQGSMNFGGGIVQTENVQVTDAFKETYSVNGATLFSGSVVDTAILQLTEDFDETIQATGESSIASGIVQVDFIEIT